jgi:hypothetical protein
MVEYLSDLERIKWAEALLTPLVDGARGIDGEINQALNALARAMARIEHGPQNLPPR